MDKLKSSSGTIGVLLIYIIVLIALYIVSETLEAKAGNYQFRAVEKIKTVNAYNQSKNELIENKIISITDSVETYDEVNGMFEVCATKDKDRDNSYLIFFIIAIVYLLSIIYSYISLKLYTKLVPNIWDIIYVFIPIINLIIVFIFLYIDNIYKIKD